MADYEVADSREYCDLQHSASCGGEVRARREKKQERVGNEVDADGVWGQRFSRLAFFEQPLPKRVAALFVGVAALVAASVLARLMLDERREALSGTGLST